MATLSGGDITALVCFTWNISDAPGRPAYPGGLFRSQAARGATRVRELPQPGPSPARKRPAVAWRAPILPPQAGQDFNRPTPHVRGGLRLPQSGSQRLSRQTSRRSGCFGRKRTPGVVGGDGPCDQRITRRKTRTQEGFTWLTHSSRISGPSPVWVATGLWMPDPRTGTARAKMAWASGIKPAF